MLSNACTLAPKLRVIYKMKRNRLLKTNQLARRILFILLSKIISRDNVHVCEIIFLFRVLLTHGKNEEREMICKAQRRFKFGSQVQIVFRAK